MADMIIKASSNNDLVIQGGDNSPAITVGNTGTTTFAENATLSGTLGVTGNTTLSGSANNLGTVTAGSIAGGSITNATTFPAGHVIQTTALVEGGTHTQLSTTDNNWQDTVVTASITPRYNNSKVVIFSDFSGFSYNSSGDGGWSCRYKRAISGGATTYPTAISIHDNVANAHSAFYWSSLTNEHMHPISTAFLDSPATTSTITYTLQGAPYHMESCYLGGYMGTQWHIWFQEIAQ